MHVLHERIWHLYWHLPTGTEQLLESSSTHTCTHVCNLLNWRLWNCNLWNDSCKVHAEKKDWSRNQIYATVQYIDCTCLWTISKCKEFVFMFFIHCYKKSLHVFSLLAQNVFCKCNSLQLWISNHSSGMQIRILRLKNLSVIYWLSKSLHLPTSAVFWSKLGPVS